MHKVSVVIPVYNEEKTIASVITTVKQWSKSTECVVVNDGSTDESAHIIGQFSGSIRVVNLKKNQGKGFAVAQGIEKSTGSIIMLLDADMKGLTTQHLDEMLKTLTNKKAHMVIGIPKTHGLLGNQRIYHQISGERVFYRADVKAYTKDMMPLGYGLELFLNNIYKEKKVEYVFLSNVYVLKKYEKYNMLVAILGNLRQAKEMGSQLFKQLFLPKDQQKTVN